MLEALDMRRFGLIGGLVVTFGVLGGCQTPSTNTLGIYGDQALNAGNYDEAVTYYEQYVDRRPLDAEGRYKLAIAYLGADRVSMAREQFILGLELKDDGRFVDGVADTLVDMGQQDELYKLLRQRAESTRSVEDYTRLGRFAAQVGDADGAEEALLLAAKLDGGQSIGPQLELAELYGRFHDDANRLKRLRMALFIDPENKEVAEQIREMGEIPGPSFALVPAERG
ncbi:MAG TPA: tetratricopeptide repeat protein [Phycisphaerales bacterium]|nr:tetratricopeptide repeat protein [Phycisphaerales bacterium]